MSTSETKDGAAIISRRAILGGLTAATVMAPGILRSVFAAGEPIGETTAGKVRGTLSEGIYTFLCVPYGASTEGIGRFMPPSPPKPWAGVHDVPKQRVIAPQSDPTPAPMPNVPALIGMMSIGSEAGSLETEDCLNVTIYTPGLDAAKRPVMFWYHGGGYASGSGSAPMYHGAALARSGDAAKFGLFEKLLTQPTK